MQGTYIRFKCETKYQQIRFNSSIIADKEIIYYVSEHKNIKVSPQEDAITLYDQNDTKIDDKTNIDPGQKITIERLPANPSEDVKIPKQRLKHHVMEFIGMNRHMARYLDEALESDEIKEEELNDIQKELWDLNEKDEP